LRIYKVNRIHNITVKCAQYVRNTKGENIFLLNSDNEVCRFAGIKLN